MGCVQGVWRVIELYSRDNRLIKLVRDAAAGLTGFKVHAPHMRDLPNKFDVVVTAGQLNVGVERFAAAKAAIVAVIPEAGYWMATEARKRGHLLVLGSDYRDVRI